MLQSRALIHLLTLLGTCHDLDVSVTFLPPKKGSKEVVLDTT